MHIYLPLLIGIVTDKIFILIIVFSAFFYHAKHNLILEYLEMRTKVYFYSGWVFFNLQRVFSVLQTHNIAVINEQVYKLIITFQL